jgi:hypothetical protein
VALGLACDAVDGVVVQVEEGVKIGREESRGEVAQKILLKNMTLRWNMSRLPICCAKNQTNNDAGACTGVVVGL